MNSENFEKYRKEFNDQLADPGAKKFLEQLGELDQIAHQTAENGYEDFDILEMKTDEVKSYAQEEGILGDKAMISGDIYPLELYEKLEQERLRVNFSRLLGLILPILMMSIAQSWNFTKMMDTEPMSTASLTMKS